MSRAGARVDSMNPGNRRPRVVSGTVHTNQGRNLVAHLTVSQRKPCDEPILFESAMETGRCLALFLPLQRRPSRIVPRASHP